MQRIDWEPEEKNPFVKKIEEISDEWLSKEAFHIAKWATDEITPIIDSEDGESISLLLFGFEFENGDIGDTYSVRFSIEDLFYQFADIYTKHGNDDLKTAIKACDSLEKMVNKMREIIRENSDQP